MSDIGERRKRSRRSSPVKPPRREERPAETPERREQPSREKVPQKV